MTSKNDRKKGDKVWWHELVKAEDGQTVIERKTDERMECHEGRFLLTEYTVVVYVLMNRFQSVEPLLWPNIPQHETFPGKPWLSDSVLLSYQAAQPHDCQVDVGRPWCAKETTTQLLLAQSPRETASPQKLATTNNGWAPLNFSLEPQTSKRQALILRSMSKLHNLAQSKNISLSQQPQKTIQKGWGGILKPKHTAFTPLVKLFQRALLTYVEATVVWLTSPWNDAPHAPSVTILLEPSNQWPWTLKYSIWCPHNSPLNHRDICLWLVGGSGMRVLYV